MGLPADWNSLGVGLAATYSPRQYHASKLKVRGHEFAWGHRTYLMGIINVTPDSFSGDGLGESPEAAAAQAKRMEAEGADWLDIGGESSRPGAEELEPAEEARRVVPAIEAVRGVTALPISVDTYHAAVAKAALAAGADAVNDIWGLRKDPEMARVVAGSGAVLIAMHNQRGRSMQNPADVVGEIRRGFQATMDICAAHGIDRDKVIFDPGFGFGWTPEQNLQIIRDLIQIHTLGAPLLIGTSRKSTIGLVLGDVPVEQRAFGTAASLALSVAAGADMIRVHDVAEMRQVAQVADAVVARGHLGVVVRPATIALGSNLGDRLANLRAAVRMLEDALSPITAKSTVWETAPDPADQPPFLNAVITMETWRSPLALLSELKRIEHALGRRPERRWGPRPIDLDILFYGDERIDLPELQVPHLRILERGFVLAPLADIQHGPLPVLGVTASSALSAVGMEGLRRVGAL